MVVSVFKSGGLPQNSPLRIIRNAMGIASLSDPKAIYTTSSVHGYVLMAQVDDSRDAERLEALRAINSELEPRVMTEAEAIMLRLAMASKFVPLTEDEATPLPVRRRRP